MKQLYVKPIFFTACLIIAGHFLIQAQTSSIYFDLDACNATLNGEQFDYSEFTGVVNNDDTCALLAVQSGHFYRNNPTSNPHSCTPGVDEDPAMCIGSEPGCSFIANSDKALRLDIMVSPGSSGNATLSEISFYEQGPPVYDWINGASGPNNYPTLFAVRVLKNGVEVFLSVDIPTELSWNLNTLNFSGNPEFSVSEPTLFHFEFLPYCPIGNGEPVSAWDIDEVRIEAMCCAAPSGGELTGGPFEFCVGDGIPDYPSGIVLSGQTGENSQWVITDETGNILSLPPSPDSVNFDGGGPGICLIWHVSYDDGLVGLVVGNNLLTDLSGCYGLSNSLTVIRNQPEGGTLSGGPFEFCVGDGIPDYPTGIVLTGNVGPNSQWVVTDSIGTILSLPTSPDSVNFDGGGPGICLIWHVSYYDTITGLVMGNNIMSDLAGCFDVSNSIVVIRNQPEGGTLTGGPFEFCAGDSIVDIVSGIVLTGNVGSTSQWVITNGSNIIIALPATLDSFDFDTLEQGTFLVWNISYFDTLSGLIPGNNLPLDISGCFAISNSISINVNQPDGGTLTGGPFEFCVGDSIPDYVTGIVLSGNEGPNSQWIITDSIGTILNLPASLDSVNFDGAGPGICLIWNVSYYDTLGGLEVGNNIFTDLSGCFDLSNSITVDRNQPEGGELTGGPFEFCVGDSIPDNISGLVLTGNVGDSFQWVLTDDENIIISLPGIPDTINFDSLEGTFLIWNISFFDTLSGLIVGNNLLEDITGCSDLSNALTITLGQPEGGELTGGPFEFCVGDSIPDYVSGVVLTGNAGPNSQWVITDSLNTILNLPASLDSVNFDGAGPGICLIWNISYFEPLTGLEVGNNLLTDLDGCFDLSNSITVNRNQPEGGTLTGGPFEFCTTDTIPDVISGIVLTGNEGESFQWVLTDEDNIILSFPSSPDSIDLDSVTSGVFQFWNISYFDPLTGLIIGNDLLLDIVGCHDLSNPITITIGQPEGGVLTGGPFTFCVGDSIPDYVSGVVLTGNSGPNSQWVITDSLNTILNLPTSLDSVNFDGAGPGICLIWNVSYFEPLSGLEVGNNLLTDLEGCFDISNSITVNRNQPEGGELTGGPFEFCTTDTIPDVISGIVLTGNVGESFEWILTDVDGFIFSFPSSPDSIELDSLPSGVYQFWNISYFDTLSGLIIGNDLFLDIEGCFDLSNPLTITIGEPDGGVLTGGPFEFCVGDSIPDYVSGVVLTGNSGPNSQWVITDSINTILNLPASLDSVNFDGAGPGICLIWNVSYFDPILGLEVGNDLLNDLEGCFDLSNSITVNRNDPEGGMLTGGPFEFCVGDSIPDHVSGVELIGNVGDSSQYVVTDSLGNILSLPSTPEEVDFNEAPPGLCLIWHVSYYGDITGLDTTSNLLTDLEGCFSLSNSIAVVRVDCEGIQGEDPIFELRINPNPVRSHMNLHVLYHGDDTPVLEVYDASGRLCMQRYHTARTDLQVDMSHLSEGIYWIRVKSDMGFKTKRILLIK